MGYVARRLVSRLDDTVWTTGGTQRTEDKGVPTPKSLVTFNGYQGSAKLRNLVRRATHLLISIPPEESGDPTLCCLHDEICTADHLSWIGYLSTTSVYGNTGGTMVDESSPLNPNSLRSERRLLAERAWLDLTRHNGRPVHIFRLSGIYGPGRSTLDQVRRGAARRIDFPSQKFARIHVDDIVAVILASMRQPNPGAIYNLCDDEPAAQSDVVEFACKLLGAAVPPLIPFGDAYAEMSDMARSFWNNNRQLSNGRIKKELGVSLTYPNYRNGLEATLEEETTT